MDDLEDIELNNVHRILEDYCREFKETYKANLEADGRRASGQLMDNLETQINFGGTTITVVLNVADYYRYVEEGRSAGKFPPVDKIIKWINDKGITPRPYNGKLPKENQLAFLIGRKIAREGYEGKDSLMRTVRDLNEVYIQKLQAALQEDFSAYQIKILDKINHMIKI